MDVCVCVCVPPAPTLMGNNAGSVEEPQGKESRSPPGCPGRAGKLPMPPEEELELRFDTVLVSVCSR